jgi:TolB protein
VPVAGSVAALPGWLYYADYSHVFRLTPSGMDPVSNENWYGTNVSPDGASIAFDDGTGTLLVADRNGQHRRTVLHNSVTAGWEPAWSPDSQRLLAGKNAGGGKVTLGIITIATGTFTPLPHQPQSAIHPLWSADGQHIAYATGTCQLATANIDGSNPHTVPIVGDLNSPANPQHRRSCDPYSISPDGTLIAVDQHTGDQGDGDIARNLSANTIIDTRTGNTIDLPVTGTITAILCQPNGDILVRTQNTTNNQLTLLSPDHTIKTHVTEPATAKNLSLLAYTPR